jgi:hypothetical protein
LLAVGQDVDACVVWHIPPISCGNLLEMLKWISHWYSEGFIYQLSLVDEKLLQHKAPAVDHSKLTMHTDTGLSGLLVDMTAKGIINTAVMRVCPDTNMCSELGGLLVMCKLMQHLPQLKINPRQPGIGTAQLVQQDYLR